MKRFALAVAALLVAVCFADAAAPARVVQVKTGRSRVVVQQVRVRPVRRVVVQPVVVQQVHVRRFTAGYGYAGALSAYTAPVTEEYTAPVTEKVVEKEVVPVQKIQVQRVILREVVPVQKIQVQRVILRQGFHGCSGGVSQFRFRAGFGY